MLHPIAFLIISSRRGYFNRDGKPEYGSGTRANLGDFTAAAGSRRASVSGGFFLEKRDKRGVYSGIFPQQKAAFLTPPFILIFFNPAL